MRNSRETGGLALRKSSASAPGSAFRSDLSPVVAVQRTEEAGLPMRQESTRCKNVLLAALPDDEYQHLSGDLERVDTVLGDSIVRENERAEWAYFPEEAVLS